MELFKTLELDNKCRSCLKPLEDMYNLYEIFDQGLSLSDIFKITTDFEVREEDGLPTNFCEKCANVLVDFYNFKTVYEKNDLYLKSIFENPDEELLKLSHVKQEKEEKTYNTVEACISADEDQISSPEEGYTFLPENECILVVDDNMHPDSNDDLGSDEELINGKSSMENSDQEEPDFSEAEDKIEIKESIVSSALNMSTEDEENTKNLEPYTCFDTSGLPEDKCILVFNDNVKPSDPKTTLKSAKSKHSKHAKSLATHNESVSLVCKVCKKEFTALPDLQKHLKTHTPFRCIVCGMNFKKKSSLIEHSSKHTSHKRKKKFVSKNQKKSRVKPEYLCEHCGKKFNDRSTIIVHRKTVHLKHRDFHCEICNLWFPLRATLQKHTLRRHTVREKTFVCSICKNSYTERYSMMRHFARKHMNVQKYTCKKCKREYGSKYTLINHVRKHHSPKADLKNFSDYCEETENKDYAEFEELIESS